MSFSRYEAYKDSGVEWLGEVPEHWDVTRAKFVSDIFVPQRNKPELNDTDGFNWITMEDMHDKYILESTYKVNKIALTDAGSKVLKKGSVIASCVGRFGISAINTVDVVINQQLQAFIPSKIQANYLQDLVTLSKGYFDLVGTVATLVYVNQQGFENMPVLLPSDIEQTKITAFLNYETARIDALIAEQQRLIELLKEKRQAVISHAVTKGLDPTVKMKDSGVEWLGEVPEHWIVTPLKHIVRESVQMGPFGSSLTDLSEKPTEFKLYGQENYISGDFQRGDRWISTSLFFALNKYEICPGDLVFTRKGSIGNCRLVPPDINKGVIDSDSIRVRVDDTVINRDFIQLLAHEAWYISEQLQSERRGAVLSGLNTSNIANLKILVPPLYEQRFLFQSIQSALDCMSNTLSSAKQAICLLQERRSALISAAVTGKIDVRDWRSPASA